MPLRIVGTAIELGVRDDPPTELEKKTHKQWFYFRVSGTTKPTTCAAKRTTHIATSP